MNRFAMKNALAGAALVSLAAAPASADLNYYWDITALGIGGPAGTVSNDLSIITDNSGFTAEFLAELTQGTFYNPSASDVPPGSNSADSYFGGGFNTGDTNATPSPVLVGAAVDLGGQSLAEGISSTIINETWIPDFERLTASSTAFPTGTAAAPAFGGRFSASSNATGTYQIRLNNENGDLVEVLTGTISNGRFSQRLTGDANLDGDVDAFQFNGGGDLQIVLANQGTGDSLLQGDLNGDDDVDAFQFNGGGDLQIVLANLGSTTPASRGVGARATYDTTTGELSFTILSDDVQVVGVESFGAAFDTGATLGQVGGVDSIQFDAAILAYFDQNGLEQGTFSAGTVLPVGLTEADLGFSYSPVGQNPIQVDIDVVPEPGSLALIGLGGLALLRRRRAA